MPTEPNVMLPVALAGLALAGAGFLRLARLALHEMPRVVAVVSVVGGMAVAASGLALSLVEDRGEPRPTIGLEPSGETAGPTAASPAPDATPGTTPAAAGSVLGEVRTVGGDPVGGATVTLRRFERTEAAETRTATTTPDGRFGFAGLPVAPTIAYTVQTTYEGATFASDLLFLDGHGASEAVALEVALPTDDVDVLEVTVDSTVLVGDRDGIQVVQITNLRNTSDRAFTGPVRLPLLAGAQGLAPRSGLVRSRLAVGEGELRSTAPVLPGETEIVYAYGLPAPTERRPVERTAVYPTGRLDLLVSGDIRVLEADGLREADEVELGTTGTERAYGRFTADALDAGDRVTAEVGFPDPGAGLRVPLIVGGVVAALAILALPMIRRRRSSRRDDDPPSPEADPAHSSTAES